jgi:signal transduction histidine kinase/integral membrane sensor domain MASE1
VPRPLRRSHVRISPRTRQACALAVVAGSYYACGKLGLSLAVADGLVSPVWAPTGIALASLLILGYRAWPAIALAAFLVNATSGAGLATAAVIAAGNTLEGLTGAYLLRRARFSPGLTRVRDVLLFVILGVCVATTVSATIGVSAVSLSGMGDHSFQAHWLIWWSGDASGALMVAPLFLVGATVGRELLRGRLLEASALLGVVVALGVLLTVAGGPEHRYIVFPALLWAAIRFRQLGAAAASLVLGALGTWAALTGTGLLAGSSATERLQSIHSLVAVVTVSLLIVGATLAERERAELGARRAADLLAEAQRLAHIGSWEWAIAENELRWSEGMYHVWGEDPVSFTPSRESFLARVHPSDRARVDVADRLALREGELGYEFRIVRPDGQERVIQARGQLVRDEDGRPRAMIGSAQDITEATVVALERERLLLVEREQNERLRELDRLKDSFLASVSHELRTPLTSIIGYLDLLGEESSGELSEEQRRHIDVALRNAARLSRLIGDLLFVAQADAGRLSLEPASVDPAEIVGECVESLAPWAAEADVELVVERMPAPTVWADQARLQQLVGNLVSNAIKFSRAGGRVTIRTGSTKGGAFLEVEDDGYGIPAEEQRRIFERFFRSQQANEQAIQGTGLGLSIAKVIAEAHGGRLTFRSSEGEGTTFRCELPAEAGTGRAEQAPFGRIAS